MAGRRVRSVPRLVYHQDPIRSSVKALGAKWTLLILRDVGFLRLNRFGQILQNNPGLTARVLSKRLKMMQKEGLLEKRVTKDMTFYRLTSRGEDAVFILLAFLRYGLKHYPRQSVPVATSRPSLQELIREYGSGPGDRKSSSST